MKELEGKDLLELYFTVVARVKKVGEKDGVTLFALDSAFSPTSSDIHEYVDEDENQVEGQLVSITNDFMEPDNWPQELGDEIFFLRRSQRRVLSNF